MSQRKQFGGVVSSVVGPVKVTVNIASIAANSVSNTAVTVPGARVGDLVLFQSDASQNNIGQVARVSADDTVALSSQNPTAAAIDPASTTYTFLLLRPAFN